MPARTVSVIVPTYNRATMLAECLQSIVDQTAPPHQIIVVDDGSQDDTPARIEALRASCGDRLFHLRTENGGKPHALNLALPHVTGEWVWIFDDDDVALLTSIQSRLDALARTPGARVLLSNHLWGRSGADGNIEPTGAHHWPAVDAGNLRLRLMRSCFTTLQGALVHADCYREVGPFREELVTSEDYDMLLRLVRRYPVALLDQPTFVFRQHDSARGPAERRYDAHERELRFLHHDRIVGLGLREAAPLGEYLIPPRTTVTEPALKRRALVNRMIVMAGKGLEREMLADAHSYAVLTGESAPTREERRGIAEAAQQRYLVLRVLQDPAAFLGGAAPLRRSPGGRAALQALARGFAGVARWGVRARRERLRLLGVAARLYGAGLPGLPRWHARTETP